MEPVEDFNREVKDALNSVISGITAPSVVDALYSHLKEHHGISPDEAPYHLSTFLLVLEGVFGVHGRRTIERAIAKELYRKCELRFVESPILDLSEYIQLARKRMELEAMERRKVP